MLGRGADATEQLTQRRPDALQQFGRDNGKNGNLAGAHDSRHLALRDNASIRHKAVFAGIERRHATRELARKTGSIGIANRQDKVHAFVGRKGHGFVDQFVSPVAPNRAAAEKHTLE